MRKAVKPRRAGDHGTDPDADNWREVGIPHRTIAWTALRVAASIAVVAALYYLLPFDLPADTRETSMTSKAN